MVPAKFLDDLQISDGLFSLTNINLHASLYGTHCGGALALPAAKPYPQQVNDFVVHLHSRQSGEGNLNIEPTETVILLNVHRMSAVPNSKSKDQISYWVIILV